MYTNTLTAKTNYHLLVTNLLKEHIEAQRLHNAYTTMCLERRRWYDQAKLNTMCQYADMKTSLLSYARFERLRTDTDVLLAHHTQQAHGCSRNALYNWRTRRQTATNKKQPYTGTHAGMHDKRSTSYKNDHRSSGTPPCGKSRCSHYQNEKKHTGIQTSGKSL